ncbi:MAG TPA: hypothetical protein VFH88_07170 [Candidatus Krumholzibacteria bacterium]|nr:hypothetical protein [Candidatus Krumholzibacteria bacterium]
MIARPENRVVARFFDGRTLAGTTIDFSPMRRNFHITAEGVPHEVSIDDLKALFFVRDFSGNPAYHDKKGFFARQNHGKKVMVEFKDDEVLFGYTLTYSSQGLGFFVFPGDPDSNNEKVFVVHASTKSVKLTTLAGNFPQTAR